LNRAAKEMVGDVVFSRDGTIKIWDVASGKDNAARCPPRFRASGVGPPLTASDGFKVP